MKPNVEVPESISLAKIREFVESLGIDATHLREFHCGMDGVYIEAFALDASGKVYANGDEIAMHRISIPLDREA